MKRIITYIAAVFSAVAMVSCAQEESQEMNDNNVILSHISFSASYENIPTKAAINGIKVNWASGDKINVYEVSSSTSTSTGYEFSAKGETENGSVEFFGSVPETTGGYYASYPYMSNSEGYGLVFYSGEQFLKLAWNGGTQHATQNSFDPEKCIMIAHSQTKELDFLHTFAYIKLTTEFECASVTISGNKTSGYSEVLSCTDVTLKHFSDSVAIVAQASPSSSVSLVPQSEEEYIPSGTYYLVVAPTVLEQGFTLTCKDVNGTGVDYVRKTDKKVRLRRAHILNLGSFDGVNPSNCFIASREHEYRFRPVKGNSDESVGDVASAKVLWESNGDSVPPTEGYLIKTVSIGEDGYIHYKTTGRKGNALIGALDASGNILWSWHIWCTDVPADQEYGNDAGTMMDRNLGSLSMDKGCVESFGLLYQWGRKDPFMGCASWSNDTTRVASTAGFSKVNLGGDSTTKAYATAHPNTFIMSYVHWCEDDDAYELWGSEKTIYDPCPAGYRVPDGGTAGVWAVASGNTEPAPGYIFPQVSGPWDSDYCGMDLGSFLGFSGSSWYPAAGCLQTLDGKLANACSSGYWWGCNISSNFPCIFMLSDDGKIYPASMAISYANGYSVRCIKE